MLSFGKSKPANLKLPEEESADRQLSSPNVQIKYEKRGGHRKRVIVVKNGRYCCVKHAFVFSAITF